MCQDLATDLTINELTRNGPDISYNHRRPHRVYTRTLDYLNEEIRLCLPESRMFATNTVFFMQTQKTELCIPLYERIGYYLGYYAALTEN